MSDPTGVILGGVVVYLGGATLTAWALIVNGKLPREHLDGAAFAAMLWWPVVALWFVFVESPRLLWRLRK